ncbi:MAG: protein kinase [Acidobacteriota bacterium]
MTPEHWQKIEELFNQAVEMPPDSRDVFLREACGDNSELRAQVEKLIQADEDAGDFIESTVPLSHITKFADALNDYPVDGMIGRKVGAYEVEREIGRGGMGAVYLASRADKVFFKRVAIKLIKRGMDTDFIIRRFRNERQILANLDHPNIARLLDGGTTDDDLPYFVMEYIEGEPLTRYSDKRKLSLADRLKLFLQVCSAVQYSHLNQIVHRDIKPSNILVTSDGKPKLLDFGIAKLLNPEFAFDTLDPTATAMRLMTPEYASPEQSRGEKVSPASDQYSLGVLLYELMTGHRPYRLTNYLPHEIVRIICETEPEKPSIVISRVEKIINRDGEEVYLTPELVSQLRHTSPEGLQMELASGLDNIIMQMLRKDVSMRYPSIEHLMADINRYLSGFPVTAPSYHPPTPVIKSNTGDDHAAQNAIAILPFKLIEISGEEDTGSKFLGIGLADSLITQLSNIRSLTVRPTASVMRYTELTTDALSVGKELNVNYVLDGRLLKSGDRIRITTQLINVKTESPQWAAQFDEKYTDILELQDSISSQVVKELVKKISGEERQKLVKRGTHNFKAFEAYLRGRYHWHTYTESGLARAITCFYEAIALDENFAAAYSGVADYHNLLGVTSVLSPADTFPAAKEAAIRALKIDNKLAEVYSSLGLTAWAYDWDAEKSEGFFKRAFELNSNYSQAYEWYGHFCTSYGRFEEAEKSMRRALEIDPQSRSLYTMMSRVYYNARRYEEAVKFADKSLELEPNYYLALQGAAWSLTKVGRFDDALVAGRKGVEVSGGNPLTICSYARALADAGKIDEARKYLDELTQAADKRYISPFFLVVVHTALGEYEAAFKQIEKLFEYHDHWALWLRVEPSLDPLRDDPRFGEVLQRLRPFKTGNTGDDEAIATLVHDAAHTRGGMVATPEPLIVNRNQVTAVMDVSPATASLVAENQSDSLPEKPLEPVITAEQTRRLSLMHWAVFALVFAAVCAIGWYVYKNAQKPMVLRKITPDLAQASVPKSIAILPFKTDATGETERSISIGIADAMTSKLSELQQFSVRPVSAVRVYFGKDVDEQKAGQELGVEYLVSGSMENFDDAVKVSAQLQTVKDGKVLWADVFDEKLTNVANLHSAIAERILRVLKIELTASQRQRLNKRYTENSEAYQLYLVGRYQWGKRTGSGLTEATRSFEQALKKDPNFAPAYAGLADCYAILNQYQAIPPADAFAKAKENALKALAIDESLAEPHASLAFVKFYSERDRAGAEKEFRRAVELNPSYATAHHWFGMMLSASGRHDEAIAEIKQAEQLDIRSPIIRAAASTVYFYARQYDQAIERANKALELDPGLVPAHRVLRWTYEAMNRYEDAMNAYQNEKSFSGDADKEWYAILTQLQAMRGERDEAIRTLRYFIASPEFKPGETYLFYELAVAFSLLNQNDEALMWLAKAEASKTHLFNFAQVDPRLDNLRAEPRFNELMRKLGAFS